MTRPYLKNALLTVLVIVSLMLSYTLTHGIFQNSSEVGLSITQPLPEALHPTMTDAASPWQIQFRRNGSGHVALDLPGTHSYNAWLNRLTTLQLAEMHVVANPPDANAAYAVQIDFGTQLDHRTLLRLIPNLQTFSLGIAGNRLVLYQPYQGSKVYLAIDSTSDSYVSDTNMDPGQFVEYWAEAAGTGWWSPLSSNAVGLIPESDIRMDAELWNTTQPDRMPLVRSFFVNPLALTTLHEGTNTIIWTDGSRVVQYNGGLRPSILFEDPNTTPTTPTQPDLQASVSFIRSHGGAPSSAIAFSDSSSFLTAYSDSFVFHQYVGGFPIVDGSGDYTIQVELGHIINYQRPLTELTTLVSHHSETILDNFELQTVLHKKLPAVPIGNLDASLGYAEVPDSAGHVWLMPSYAITANGTLTLLLDAHTGRVLKGGPGR